MPIKVEDAFFEEKAVLTGVSVISDSHESHPASHGSGHALTPASQDQYLLQILNLRGSNRHGSLEKARLVETGYRHLLRGDGDSRRTSRALTEI